ncbi:MAG: serine/threonine protein kinase [Acidobacteriota bacterium]|jgi:Ser/Thr protein kinase RdoA (MazF antagonist)
MTITEPPDTRTDLFLDLTPERVLEAVEAAGLETNPVCYPLNAYENRVYEVELADKSRVVAKFYRPTRWSRDQILDEHRFLHELAEQEVPVCTFREFPEGGTLRTIDGIHYGLSDRRGGRAPDEITDELAHRIGMLAGRIHAAGARGDAPHRPRLTSEWFVHRHLEWMHEHGTLPDHLEAAYFQVAREIAALYDELAREGDGAETIRIHGDLHVSNLLLRDGVLRVLDFDDMVVGPPVQDLWLCLPGRDADTRRLHEAFIEGYETFRLFDRSTLRLVEPLRGLRIVNYSAWLARRWHDPFFPLAFPHFGTEEYWRSELGELEETLRVARREAGGDRVVEEEEPELLTNADYFWDWED